MVLRKITVNQTQDGVEKSEKLRKMRESVPAKQDFVNRIAQNARVSACRAGLANSCTMRKWFPMDFLKSLD